MSDPEPASRRVPICGIAASVDGVEALQQFLKALPLDLGLAYVVIVHGDEQNSELVSLAQSTAMPVTPVEDPETTALTANHVYVVSPQRDLEIDRFFRALAADVHGLAVVLSGRGTQGAVGAKAVKEASGVVLVQDPN